MYRARGLASAAAALTLLILPVSGLYRTLAGAVSQGNELEQWEHVRRHEQRFIQALRSSTAAEDDDASI